MSVGPPRQPPHSVRMLRGAGQVQGHQCVQRLTVRQVGIPPVSHRHGCIHVSVGVYEPLRTGIVQVGQGADRECLRRRAVKSAWTSSAGSPSRRISRLCSSFAPEKQTRETRTAAPSITHDSDRLTNA